MFKYGLTEFLAKRVSGVSGMIGALFPRKVAHVVRDLKIDPVLPRTPRLRRAGRRLGKTGMSFSARLRSVRPNAYMDRSDH
jgi:hypothetical protein